MPPKKVKEATKGAKQIVSENAATVKFYRNLALGSTVIYVAAMLTFFYEDLTAGSVVLLCLTTAIFVGCNSLLSYAARASYSEDGALLDCGTDLTMAGGVAEHVLDMIILTAGAQVLSLISNYFWLLLLLAPVRIAHLLWRSILSPWFFQEAPPQPENDEKKQRKLERKMKQRN